MTLIQYMASGKHQSNSNSRVSHFSCQVWKKIHLLAESNLDCWTSAIHYFVYCKNVKAYLMAKCDFFKWYNKPWNGFLQPPTHQPIHLSRNMVIVSQFIIQFCPKIFHIRSQFFQVCNFIFLELANFLSHCNFILTISNFLK